MKMRTILLMAVVFLAGVATGYAVDGGSAEPVATQVGERQPMAVPVANLAPSVVEDPIPDYLTEDERRQIQVFRSASASRLATSGCVATR